MESQSAGSTVAGLLNGPRGSFPGTGNTPGLPAVTRTHNTRDPAFRMGRTVRRREKEINGSLPGFPFQPRLSPFCPWTSTETTITALCIQSPLWLTQLF